MPRIWLRFRSGIYTIMHVCLSISNNLCCKIKIVSLWVHLNAIPPCVIVKNLSWPPIFQDFITNRASGCILVFSHLFKPYYIIKIKELWTYMLFYFLPSEWMRHCVYLLWPCPGFSIISRMKYIMILQWSFRINTW